MLIFFLCIHRLILKILIMTSFLISKMLLDMRLLWDRAMSYTSQCIGKIVFKYIEKVDYHYYFIMKCVVTPGWDYLFGQPKAEGKSVWKRC